MRNDYPEKAKGDLLLATEVNKLFEHSRKFERMVSGSFMGMHHGGANVSLFGTAGFVSFPVIVSNRNIGKGDIDTSGLYRVRPRVYVASTGEWVSLDNEYIMDERALGGNPGGFLVDDLVVCAWIEQAGVFIPVASPDILRPSALDAALVSGGFAAAHFLIGEDRDETGISFTVYDLPTMITASKQIPNETVVRVVWDRIAGKWVLGIPSECEEDQ